MPFKNYYVVLGVSRDEKPAGIRSAYRKLAKEMHPDLAGESGTKQFQEIAEAYSVLSDPARRRAHDRKLDDASVRVKPATFEGKAESLRVEPLDGRGRFILMYRACPTCQGSFPHRFYCYDCGGHGYQLLRGFLAREEWW
jgi:DnaJ-class molecular chaperone